MTPKQRRELAAGLRSVVVDDKVTVLDLEHAPPRVVEVLTVLKANATGIWTSDGTVDGKTRWSIRDGCQSGCWNSMIRPLQDGDEKAARLAPLRREVEIAEQQLATAKRAVEWGRESVRLREEELVVVRQGLERQIAAMEAAAVAAAAATALLREAEGEP